ncbi:sialidase family protein [Compostibacter hankyongensis]|uniref:Exo-alpha-sialidase n=1 Tax=Compostibacter hankyongensis TaxID=1007089 RepID=A0ABP8FJC7_9BACT
MKPKSYLNLSGILFAALILQACHSRPHTRSDKTAAAPVTHTDTLPLKDFLFGDDHPFPQCHASTLIRLGDGSFLAAWFGGTREKDDDVGIWMTKGRPGHWRSPAEVAKIRQEPHWNPVLFRAPGGKIYLFFKVGKEIARWETWVKTSADDGETWSEARELVPGDRGGRGPVRNKILVLSDSTWLAGASNENGPWNAFFDRSRDEGKTWSATPYLDIDRDKIKGKGIIQPTLWESSPGNVHALLRSASGRICRSDSKDYGRTWSPVYATDLPNPNSAIDVARLPDGTLVLALNPTDKERGDRSTLSLALSFDNGRTWPKKLDIEKGSEDDEFSYPAVIHAGDTVMVTYTWKRKKIAFWEGTKDWIIRHAGSFR